MILTFLMGFLAAVAIMTVVAIAVMCGKWLKEYIKRRLKNKEKHKIAFGDTREIVDEYLRNKADNADEVSMEDLEKMCDEMPFVAADVDEDGEISDYEGFKAKEVDANFKARMRQQNGMILVEA